MEHKIESNIGLSKANQNDCKYIYELLCLLEETTFDYDVFCKNYLANLQNTNIDYFTITCDHEQCGFISVYTQTLLHHNGKICEIQELIIEEKYRGKSVGRNVIKLIRDMYKRNNVLQIEVCTNKIRQDTQRFYKNNDFIETHYKYVMKI